MFSWHSTHIYCRDRGIIQCNSSHTVNVVMFAGGGGGISRICLKDISLGGNFHDCTPISFLKAYGFYFRVGVIFAKKTKSRKTRKLPPRVNFHVYSNIMQYKCVSLRSSVCFSHVSCTSLHMHWHFQCSFTYRHCHISCSFISKCILSIKSRVKIMVPCNISKCRKC